MSLDLEYFDGGFFIFKRELNKGPQFNASEPVNLPDGKSGSACNSHVATTSHHDCSLLYMLCVLNSSVKRNNSFHEGICQKLT